MKATEILMSEHRVIEQVIGALETAATKMEEGAAVRPGFFIEATDFIKGFADGCHHRKEENVLFETMNTWGVPVQNGPIGVMLNEHVMGRTYTQNLRKAAQGMAGSDPRAAEEVIENARGYALLLRQHIYKEDNILFPMADRAIPAENHEGVFEGFERVEHEETGEGVHEKYLALANRLVSEAAAL